MLRHCLLLFCRCLAPRLRCVCGSSAAPVARRRPSGWTAAAMPAGNEGGGHTGVGRAGRPGGVESDVPGRDRPQVWTRSAHPTASRPAILGHAPAMSSADPRARVGRPRRVKPSPGGGRSERGCGMEAGTATDDVEHPHTGDTIRPLQAGRVRPPSHPLRLSTGAIGRLGARASVLRRNQAAG